MFFILFMFFSFKHCLPALTFKHYSGFSCLNTFLFNLLLSLYITKNTVPFENYFSEAVEERADVQFCVSELFQNHLWEISGDQILCEALVTDLMIIMFWLQFLRH